MSWNENTSSWRLFSAIWQLTALPIICSCCFSSFLSEAQKHVHTFCPISCLPRTPPEHPSGPSNPADLHDFFNRIFKGGVGGAGGSGGGPPHADMAANGGFFPSAPPHQSPPPGAAGGGGMPPFPPPPGHTGFYMSGAHQHHRGADPAETWADGGRQPPRRRKKVRKPFQRWSLGGWEVREGHHGWTRLTIEINRGRKNKTTIKRLKWRMTRGHKVMKVLRFLIFSLETNEYEWSLSAQIQAKPGCWNTNI